jgi:tetratricopeptide (TPR) repeat protein
MKQVLALVIFIFAAGAVCAQGKMDPVYAKLQRPANDTAKANALNTLARHHINHIQDSVEFYLEKAMQLSRALNYQYGITQANITRGVLETDKGNFPEALELLLTAEKEAGQLNDARMLSGVQLLIGNVYFKTGDVPRAMETYKKGLAMAQQYKLYANQASFYTSIGMSLRSMGELDSALYYYDRVLEVQQDFIHDSVVIAAAYNNIAAIHFMLDDMKTSENYLLKSYEINLLTGNEKYQLMNLGNLGAMAGNKDGNLEKAMEYYRKAIAMGERMGAKEALEGFYFAISQIQYNHGHFKDAYENLVTSLAYKDSVMNENKQSQILAISEEFKTQKIQDSLRLNQQALKLSQSNAEAAAHKADTATWQLIGSGGFLLFILVVLVIVYRTSQNQKKINALLQEKNDKINTQKVMIEEKNNELTDSISYAKRIQLALLPSSAYLKKILGDHFLMFKPKDIVSGDFYWVKKNANKHYFAVADCTGHGVPGAMMSMLGYETIEKISADTISDAAVFLSRINEAMMQSLSSKAEETDASQNQVKDGMDLSMCVVSEKQKLSYCGANNECYVIRRNDREMPAPDPMIHIHKGKDYSIIELKATKRPIGFYHADHQFKSVELQLFVGDMFFLFSDGYADQFGGDKGKKMKTSTFREVLLQNADKPMSQQLQALEDHLERWKSNFDQLDDITVLGVKVE